MTTTIDFSVDCLEEAGTYDVVLDAAYYQRWKPARKAPVVERIVWDLKVAGGKHDGRVISHVTELRPDVLVGVYRTLKAFGFDPPTLWEFEFDDGDGRLVDPLLEGAQAQVWVTPTSRGFVRTRVGTAA